MCMIPKPPTPIGPRSTPRAPDIAEIGGRSDETLRRRATLASMVLTPPGGLGAAPTAGKAVLGA